MPVSMRSYSRSRTRQSAGRRSNAKLPRQRQHSGERGYESFRQFRSLVVGVIRAAEAFGQELYQVSLLRRGDFDVVNFFVEPLVRDTSFGVVVDHVFQRL